MRAARIARTAIAIAVAGLSCASQAAPTAQDKLLAELKRLAERVEKLEKRNTELEAKLAAGTAASAAAPAKLSGALDGIAIEGSGAEQVAELYYRGHLNDQLSLTPDLQYVRRAAANRDAKNMTAFGVRALYAF